MSKAALNPTAILKYGILVLLVGYVFYPSFVWMVDRWFAGDSYYGHGFLIPIVSLYWFYKKRAALAAAPKSFGMFGIPFLVLGLALHIFSSMMRVYFISGFTFILIFLGIAAVLFGWEIFKKIWFPIAFLSLAVPMPLLVISESTLKMKFFVSEIAARLLTFTGLHSVREGSYIFTPHAYIIVGDPCSGLRSFLAFICLGFVFAYESKLPVWKRAVLVAAGLPLAILSNVVRVYALGFLAEIYGMNFIHGFIHDASGFVVFILAFGAFMAIRKQLEAPHAV